MLRRLLAAVGLLVGVGLVAAAVGLGAAHLAIRRERAPLPSLESLLSLGSPAALDPVGLAASSGSPGALRAKADLPVRLSVINTASQAMPRSAVLDAARDPTPAAPYVMSHPSFALEWPDGRILLIDAGMTRDGAAAFGRPIEWLSGGRPIAPLGSTAEQLGAARERVAGMVFTHLHVDHVGGVSELCVDRATPLRVFMSEAEDERLNFTDRPGRSRLREAGCVEVVRLAGEAAAAVPGFPGVAVIRAGGHTPGSQIVVAQLETPTGPRRYVFTGDTANALDGVRHDVPKPLLYRLLVVPEDEDRQGEMRAFVRDLVAAGFTPLVSHDQLELEKSGVPAWRASPYARAGP